MRIPDGVQGRSILNQGKIMQLTPDEIEAERERFEAWITAKYGTLCFARDANGAYRPWINETWQGWLAAIASERARRKQGEDEAEALLKMQGWPEMEHRREKREGGE